MIDDKDASSSTLRSLAWQTLKNFNDEALIKLLLDEDYIVRTLAARELHMRSNENIFQQVVTLLDHKNDNIREVAIFTLGQLGSPNFPFKRQSLPVMLKAMNDQSSSVRATAASSIGHLCRKGMPDSIKNALLKASKDNCSDVRSTVAYALGNAPNSIEVRNAIADLLNDPDKEVRSYAELGLDILEDKQA